MLFAQHMLNISPEEIYTVPQKTSPTFLTLT